MSEAELPLRESGAKPSPLQTGAATAFLVSAWIFAAGVALQVYFAGAGILVNPNYFGYHVTFAHLLEAMLLVLLIAGLLGRAGRRAIGWVGMLFLLYSLQYALVHGFAGPARALHAVNALVLFWVAMHLGRRQLRAARGLPAVPADANHGLRRGLVIAGVVLVPLIMAFAMITSGGEEAAAEPASFVDAGDADPAPSPASSGEPLVAADVTQGAEIFKARCSACHGEEGEGGFGPRLAGGDLDDAEPVIEQILNGGGGMPAFRNQLSDAQIAGVATFVRTSWGNDHGLVNPELVSEIR